MASGIDYQPFGPVNRITFANGLTQTKTYDLHYRPDTLVTNDGGSIQLQNLDYGFDPVGTLNPIIDNIDANNTQTFSYDDQYRLTNAAGGYGNYQYGYDATGNRLSRSLSGTANNFTENVDYTNPLTTNQLQAINGGNNPRTFTYTDNCNLAGDSTGREFIYDDNNRLIEVKQNAASIANYGYNALGQRDSKTTLNGTGHFIYGLDGKLLFETIPGSTTFVSRTYVYLDGMPIAMLEDVTPMQAASLVPAGPLGVIALLVLVIIIYRYRHSVLHNQTLLRGVVIPLLALTGLACGGGGEPGGGDETTSTYFYVNDHLGTPQLLTNSDKGIVWKGNYTPFGEVDEVVQEVQQPLRFPGQYHDTESGLYYNMMRDYDPALGRYVQSDPIGLLDGPNTFIYAHQNPIIYFDPDGEAAVIGVPIVPIGIGIGLIYCYLNPACSAALEEVSRRVIEQPAKPKRGVTCTCRASSNGLQEGNCPDEEFAFGTATAPTYRQARAEAERIARRKLGKQAKHTQCKCTDNKGNRFQ